MLDTKALGTKIKELRCARGLTQGAFAEELHVSFQAVSNWERGVAPPELDNLIRIASYFNILVDDLVRAQKSEPVILGIDGGGTKTEFAVCTMDGYVLKSFKRAGCNPNDVGFDGAFDIIYGGIREAMLEFPSVHSIFCGISGIASGNYKPMLIEKLTEKLPTVRIGIQNDSSNLFALDDASGMAIISGTGSVVFVKNDIAPIRVGGWGFLFNEGGSAFAIGRDAVINALAEEDALEAPCILSGKLRERLGTATVWGAVDQLYKGGKSFIASLSPIVFEAYAENDPKAMAIVEENARRLAELLNIAVKTHSATPRAIASGGIFEHHWDVMLPNIAKYTDTEIVLCNLPPIFGACRQAYKLVAEQTPDDFYKNFNETYKGAKK